MEYSLKKLSDFNHFSLLPLVELLQDIFYFKLLLPGILFVIVNYGPGMLYIALTDLACGG